MITFLLLSFLVLAHELGHFLAARKFGVKVEEFGFGLPPKALTIIKKGETEYTLNWLPIGGFVRLLGEDEDPSLWDKLSPVKRKRALYAKPAWQRAIIMLAGIGMNILVGIVFFSVIYSVMGIPKQIGEQVVVSEVVSGSPAEQAGIIAGEVVVRVGDMEVSDANSFVGIIQDKKGEMVSLYIAQLNNDGTVADSSRQVSVIPRENPPEGEGALGVGVASYPVLEYQKQPWYLAPWYGIVEGVKESYGWTKYMLELFLHPVELWQGMGGPVKVVQIGQEQAAAGWIAFLRFGGIISFNLAVFNLLPLPALDGGRVVFLFVEKLFGKKKTAKVEKWVHGVGILLLIGLLIVVTARDLLG